MSIFELSLHWVRKWTLICGVLIIIGVLLPVVSAYSNGYSIVWFHTYLKGNIHFNSLFFALVVVVVTVMPLVLRFSLHGKAFAACMLCYSVLLVLVFSGTLAMYSANITSLFFYISLGDQLGKLADGRLLPLVFCLVAIGCGYNLSRKFPTMAFPFVISGIGSGLLLLTLVGYALFLAVKQPAVYKPLLDAQGWRTGWHIFSATALLTSMALWAFIFSITGAGMRILRWLFLGTLVATPLILLTGEMVHQAALLNTAKTFAVLLLIAKLAMLEYGRHALLAVSLIAVIEQNTMPASASTRPSQNRQPPRRENHHRQAPTPRQEPSLGYDDDDDDDDLEQTVIVR